MEAEYILQHDSALVTAAWNDEESEILTASAAGALRLWSVDGQLRNMVLQADAPLAFARYLPGSQSLLSADENGNIRHHRAADAALLQQWQLPGAPVALQLDTAARRLFACSREGNLAVFALDDGRQLARFDTPEPVIDATWSADESSLRAWSAEGNIYQWQLGSGAQQQFSLPSRSMLLGMAWNSDDSRVLAWFRNGAVNLHDVDADAIRPRAATGHRHRSFVQRAIWSRDDARVMSWAGDDRVSIWATSDGRSLQVFEHEDWVIGARWDAAEERVLSWAHIYVYLWQGELLLQRLRHDSLLQGARWDAAGERILSWSWDGTARIWAL